MSRLNVPSPDDVPDGVEGILDNVGAQFGFVPNMFATLASNPTVLDVRHDTALVSLSSWWRAAVSSVGTPG
ncbi:hypothetical protein [Microbispora siamensis]|uniref:Uncharacterized protein n=1 Tax=Microbispora siamensis TaxID=564413 RepID=A0ABQ4GGU8_9ACTN|nr:hypothetical protein [Microbispora siamensis]GIH60649.1 hypothetical protein Msi02_14660 [Microbispora siamensis]